MFTPRGATLEDVLYNYGAASVMIYLLDLDDKRSLRLVNHAAKDAVDNTVTSVYMPGVVRELKPEFYEHYPGTDYASILSNSNWKDIKWLGYSTSQTTSSGDYYEPQGLTQIAEAGLSKLESLTLLLPFKDETDRECADKMVKAGWKLKKLKIRCQVMPSEWFGTLMRDANWPLEELTLYGCTDSIASLIATSDWKLKVIRLENSRLLTEGVEALMKGSWVSTVERLVVCYCNDTEKKGIRAISQASHRAANLLQLEIITGGFVFNHKDALILAEGSYPNLKQLRTTFFIQVSGIAAILRKCPKLEEFNHSSWYFSGRLYLVDDPEDAKLVAEYYKNGILRISGDHFIVDKFKRNLAPYL